MRFIKSTVIFYAIYLVLEFLWDKISPLPGPEGDISFDSVERMIDLTIIVTVIMLLLPLAKMIRKPRRRKDEFEL
ncbi:MAG TPA: hypothetical protein VGF14_01290 [Alphaproteobacteria bacterium]